MPTSFRSATPLPRRRAVLTIALALCVVGCATDDHRGSGVATTTAPSVPSSVTSVAPPTTQLGPPPVTDPMSAPLPAPVAGPPLTDATSSFGLPSTKRYGRGVSVIDIDGDGWDDLVITDTDSRVRGRDFVGTRFFHNVKGRLRLWDLGVGTKSTFENGAAVFGDIDNDGQPDLLLVAGNNTGRATMAFYMNRLRTEGRFVEATNEVGLTREDGLWWSASWFDFDHDGFLDLVVTGSKSIVYRNDGAGHLVDETTQRGFGVWTNDPCERNPVVIDIDNDSWPDLFCSATSKAALFHNDHGTFTDVTATAFPTNLPNYWWSRAFAGAAADFNQDGFDDLYVGRWNFQDWIMLNDGKGHFVRHDTDVGLIERTVAEDPGFDPRPQPDTTAPYWNLPPTDDQGRENTMGLMVDDIDLDGFPDVVIGTGDPSTASPDVFFCNQGGETLRIARCGADLVAVLGETRMHGIAVGDLDGDALPELVMSPGGFPPWDANNGQDTREVAHVFKATGDNTNVVTLRLTTRGRAAIGARIKVPGARDHYATVRTVQGFQSQSSQTLSFRVDGPTGVEITWPDGSTSVEQVVPGDRKVVAQAPPAG